MENALRRFWLGDAHHMPLRFFEIPAGQNNGHRLGITARTLIATGFTVRNMNNKNSSLYVLSFTSEFDSLKQAMHMNARRTQREGV